VQIRWIEALKRMRHMGVQEDYDKLASWIRKGVDLEFDSQQRPPRRNYSNTRPVNQHKAEVQARLDEYRSFGALIHIDKNEGADFIQPLHCIVKEGKKIRLVLDLSRNLNDYLKYHYFKYSTVQHAVQLSYPGCWFVKVDLSNCYLSFPVSEESAKYYTVMFNGRIYRFTRLPFGLSSAPLICTRLLSVLQFVMEERNCKLLRYLDDTLFVASSESEAQRMLEVAREVYSDFGLVINEDKTSGPTQRIIFLGIVIDSLKQSLECTTERVQQLVEELQGIKAQQWITRAAYDSLLGRLSFAAQVLPGSKPFTRWMRDTGKGLSNARNTHIPITTEFRVDIQFWLDRISTWNGRESWQSNHTAPFILASDASDAGFGFYMEQEDFRCGENGPGMEPNALNGPVNGIGFSGKFEEELRNMDIGTKEMFAVLAAVNTFADRMRNSAVQIMCDNEGDVAILNRQQSKSQAISGILRAIFSLAFSHNLNITAVHRPGIENELADFLSRPNRHGDNYLAAWCDAHPDQAHRLLRVDVIDSRVIQHLSLMYSSKNSQNTQ
jgi:hypothetical protein